jgi:galactosamine-6-phosphate isomerase
LGFNNNPTDPSKECDLIQKKLNQQGSIDLSILGIGMNGHLAFNEPADFLQPHCHNVKFSTMSLSHTMTSEMNLNPTYGITLGMSDILNSNMILILINGLQKRTIVRKFLSKEIASSVPASFLWLHPQLFV